MKKIWSFLSTNFTPMEKRVTPSSLSSGLGVTKQKPMKRTTIRKHKHKKRTTKDLFLNKAVSYLFSDYYMYNPLVSHQPTFDFPPPKQTPASPESEEDAAMPIDGSNKKLIENIVDYLEADCYLYSPLLPANNQHLYSKIHPANPASETQGGEMREKEDKAGEGGARPTVVTKRVAYRESVKHMVHQNYRSKPIKGALLDAEPRKLRVE